MQKILYLFFFLYTSFGFAQTTFDEWFLKGLDAKSHLKFEEAIRCFDECIKITSPKPKATQLAEAYTERGYCKNQKPLFNYASAKLDFDASIQLHPTLETYQRRGNTNISLQDFRGAIADFTSAIALNPNGFQLYLLRGKCHYSLKEYEESIPDFRKTHQLSPQNEESLAFIARCYYELDRIDEGLKACENYFAKGFQNGKNAGETYYYFGHFLEKKARVIEAIENFTIALEKIRHEDQLLKSRSHYERGLLYEQTGELKKAVEDFTALMILGAENGKDEAQRLDKIFIEDASQRRDKIFMRFANKYYAECEAAYTEKKKDRALICVDSADYYAITPEMKEKVISLRDFIIQDNEVEKYLPMVEKRYQENKIKEASAYLDTAKYHAITLESKQKVAEWEVKLGIAKDIESESYFTKAENAYQTFQYKPAEDHLKSCEYFAKTKNSKKVIELRTKIKKAFLVDKYLEKAEKFCQENRREEAKVYADSAGYYAATVPEREQKVVDFRQKCGISGELPPPEIVTIITPTKVTPPIPPKPPIIIELFEQHIRTVQRFVQQEKYEQALTHLRDSADSYATTPENKQQVMDLKSEISSYIAVAKYLQVARKMCAENRRTEALRSLDSATSYAFKPQSKQNIVDTKIELKTCLTPPPPKTDTIVYKHLQFARKMCAENRRTEALRSLDSAAAYASTPQSKQNIVDTKIELKTCLTPPPPTTDTIVYKHLQFARKMCAENRRTEALRSLDSATAYAFTPQSKQNIVDAKSELKTCLTPPVIPAWENLIQLDAQYVNSGQSESVAQALDAIFNSLLRESSIPNVTMNWEVPSEPITQPAIIYGDNETPFKVSIQSTDLVEIKVYVKHQPFILENKSPDAGTYLFRTGLKMVENEMDIILIVHTAKGTIAMKRKLIK